MQINNCYFFQYFKTLNSSWVSSKNLKKYPGFFFFIFQLIRFKPLTSSFPIICFNAKRYKIYAPFFFKPKKLKFFTKTKKFKIIYRFV